MSHTLNKVQLNLKIEQNNSASRLFVGNETCWIELPATKISRSWKKITFATSSTASLADLSFKLSSLSLSLSFSLSHSLSLLRYHVRVLLFDRVSLVFGNIFLFSHSNVRYSITYFNKLSYTSKSQDVVRFNNSYKFFCFQTFRMCSCCCCSCCNRLEIGFFLKM